MEHHTLTTMIYNTNWVALIRYLTHDEMFFGWKINVIASLLLIYIRGKMPYQCTVLRRIACLSRTFCRWSFTFSKAVKVQIILWVMCIRKACFINSLPNNLVHHTHCLSLRSFKFGSFKDQNKCFLFKYFLYICAWQR